MWGNLFDVSNPFISADNTLMLWTVCVVGATVAIVLEQKYDWAAKVTGAIIALVLAIILSNFGIIPMDCGVWDAVWGYVVPLAIPLLLLQCDMRKIGKEAGRLLLIFLIGSVGTAFGAIIGYGIFSKFIPELAALAGVFTGTYIGGTVNFAALGAAFKVSNNMMAAATVADNLLMVLYFFVLIAIPSIGFFRKNFKHPYLDKVESMSSKDDKGSGVAGFWARKEMSLKDIALAVSTTFVVFAASTIVSDLFNLLVPGSETAGPLQSIAHTFLTNKYLWITTISMILATAAPKFCNEIKGSNEIGTFFIYIFFFVIGVPASVVEIVKNSPLLLAFAAVVVFINMLVSFVLGKIFKFNLEEIILASNANIGGPTTAAAMAVSKGWTDLVGPVVLVGTLGYVLGTYAGIIVGNILGL